MPITPVGHRLLVKPDPIEEKTVGGIYITTDVTRVRDEQAQTCGTVVAVGKNCWKAFDDGSAWCQEGDHISFAKYGGFVIKDPTDGVEYRLLNDEDVVALLKE